MKYILLVLLVVSALSANANDKKNFLFLSAATVDSVQNGKRWSINPNAQVLEVDSWENRQATDSFYFVTYQRITTYGPAFGLSVGTNGFKALSIGFGF